MIRTVALVALALLVTGCVRYQSAPGGPFARQKKEPPPPYGAGGRIVPANKPVGNQSPLGIAAAEPAPPLPPDERALVPPKPTAPSAAPDAAAQNLAELKALVAVANAAWKRTDNYEAALTRRELTPKGETTNESLSVQVRREPMSIYSRNVGGDGRGRETLYYPGRHGDKLYIVVGQGDSKLVKPGFVAPPISPDDPKVKEKARYSIRDAGFGRPIGALSTALARVEAGMLPPDAIVYDGPVKREEYPYPLVGVTHKLRPGDDALLPSGTRVYFFDMKKDSPSYGMPVLVVATDGSGREVEYYLFDKVRSPAGLTDADFDPARLGKKK